MKLNKLENLLVPNSESKAQLELLENAEYYLDDAIQFLRQGRMELAVLSVGYADGLVDALKQILE